MTNEEKNKILIEKYLAYELSDEEWNDFEKKMTNDDVFAKKVNLYRDTETVLNSFHTTKEDKVLEQSLRTSMEKVVGNKTALTNESGSKRYWLLALGILIISVVSYFIYTQLATETSPKVYAFEYWETTENAKITEIRGGSTEETIELAVQRFQEKDYATTLTLLNSIDTTVQSNPQLLLLKGQNYFRLNEYQKAVDVFQTVIDQYEGQKDSGLWYQALSYLAMERTDEAKTNFQTIIDEDYPLESKAKELLEQL